MLPLKDSAVCSAGFQGVPFRRMRREAGLQDELRGQAGGQAAQGCWAAGQPLPAVGKLLGSPGWGPLFGQGSNKREGHTQIRIA